MYFKSNLFFLPQHWVDLNYSIYHNLSCWLVHSPLDTEGPWGQGPHCSSLWQMPSGHHGVRTQKRFSGDACANVWMEASWLRENLLSMGLSFHEAISSKLHFGFLSYISHHKEEKHMWSVKSIDDNKAGSRVFSQTHSLSVHDLDDTPDMYFFCSPP